MAEILEVTDSTFEQEILKSELPVLVDVWAEWCAPCRALTPVIKELADEYQDRLRVAKIDADANPTVTANLGVRALPTVLLFKNGQVAEQLIGNQPKQKLVERIDALLSG